MSSGNPAGRLLVIVKEARSLDDNLTIRDAWLRILKVERNDHALLLYRPGKVMQLPGQAMAALQEYHPERLAHQRHWLVPIEKAFLICMTSSNGTRKWNSVKSLINEQTVGFLDMVSALLESAGGNQEIQEDQLASMRGKLEDVLKELEATNLSGQARAMIRRHVYSALSALDEYKISGKQGIEQIAHQAVGELAVNRELREEVSGTPVGQKFSSALMLIMALISTANDSLQLASNVPQFLADMRPAEEQVVDLEEGSSEESQSEM